MERAIVYRSRGFSLLELVIVVVIIGIIGAIAIPRMSRGAEGAAESALRADLAVMRSAIDLYATEHGGKFPGETAITDTDEQLTQFTDSTGAYSATKTTTHIYGPYLRKSPPLPLGAAKGGTGIAAAPAAGVGWIYTPADGVIKSNTTAGEMDDEGTLYSAY